VTRIKRELENGGCDRIRTCDPCSVEAIISGWTTVILIKKLSHLLWAYLGHTRRRKWQSYENVTANGTCKSEEKT